MIKILFQSDDYGITRGVTEGIIDAIENGVIRNTGLFVNMPNSQYAVNRIKDYDVCLGIDINLVSGYSVSKPEQVHKITKEYGKFYSSKEIINNNKLIKKEGLLYYFEKDPYPLEEALIETENQVKEFVRLTGRLPEYLHAHSLCTPNTDKAAKMVAEKYGIYRTVNLLNKANYLKGNIEDLKGKSLIEQINSNVIDNIINKSLPMAKEDIINFYIFHCGYVDAELFDVSSLTLERFKDLEAAKSKQILKYIEENQIQLITYRDLNLK